MEGWSHTDHPHPGPILDRRHRKQDIAWLGYSRFAIVWIPTGGVLKPGEVWIKKYNVDANWESTVSVLQQNALAVQALTSDAIDLGPCVFAFGAGASAGESHKYRTFIAVYGAEIGPGSS